MKSIALATAGMMLWLSLAPPAFALFSEVTIADEAEMGREFHQKILQMMPLVEDPSIVNYVKSVVDRVVGAMPPQPFRVTTTVINNGSMNAFAVPGGYVYVLTGLLLNLQTEDELAAVICHEMAHVSQRHVAKRMEDMELASIGSYVGLIAGAFLGAGGGENSHQLGKALMVTSQAGAAAAFLVYTKANEVEADHVGMNYLIKAGYNPQAMRETFTIMLDKRWGATTSSSLPSYLSTHPALGERIDYLGTRTKELPANILAQRADNDRFLRVQSLVRGRLSDPTSSQAYFNNMKPADFGCLDYMAEGMVLARVKKQAEAGQAFERALTCGGNDPMVLREAGRFFFLQGKFERATSLLQQALVRDPTDAITLFYNARLLGEQKKYPQAISTMQRVLKEVPKDSEVHYHLGRLLGESGDLFQAHLHLAYAAFYDKDDRQARFHYDKAAAQARSPEQKAELKELDDQMHGRPGDGPGDGPGNGPGGGAKG
ncbi:MAG: M48 family metalloprotease [Desulfovibrio sp.]